MATKLLLRANEANDNSPTASQHFWVASLGRCWVQLNPERVGATDPSTPSPTHPSDGCIRNNCILIAPLRGLIRDKTTLRYPQPPPSYSLHPGEDLDMNNATEATTRSQMSDEKFEYECGSGIKEWTKSDTCAIFDWLRNWLISFAKKSYSDSVCTHSCL